MSPIQSHIEEIQKNLDYLKNYFMQENPPVKQDTPALYSAVSDIVLATIPLERELDRIIDK